MMKSLSLQNLLSVSGSQISALPLLEISSIALNSLVFVPLWPNPIVEL